MGNKNILIIDDNRGICETMSDIFKDKGYSVSIAYTGHSAMEIIKKQTFNIALIDIKLPDIDGIVLLHHFARNSPKMECMIITGHGTLRDAIQALDKGARGFFTKPFHVEDVLLRVEDVLEKQQLRQHLAAERKKLITSLNEKETLLKEIHHRVKNNLQTIISLLRLQSHYFQDKKIKDAFQSSQNRIKSIALIHESLYRSSDLKSFDFGSHIQKLAMLIWSSAGELASRVQMDIKIKDIYLDINKAIPCSLIINELLTNALEHAFPDKQAAKKEKVSLKMHPAKNGRYKLSVCDNGIGFPEDIDFSNTSSMGLQLVSDLVVQLGGTIKLKIYKGTAFTICF